MRYDIYTYVVRQLRVNQLFMHQSKYNRQSLSIRLSVSIVFILVHEKLVV